LCTVGYKGHVIVIVVTGKSSAASVASWRAAMTDPPHHVFYFLVLLAAGVPVNSVDSSQGAPVDIDIGEFSSDLFAV
jgi:hypothetical protein